jgi:hypothetical protein
VKVVYSDSAVEICHQQELLIAHPRTKQKYGYSTINEYMPSHHRFISEWSSEKFITWPDQIGGRCKTLIISALENKQHPEQFYK